MVWYGMVWYGMVWYGMVWYGMVWYGMVWYSILNDEAGCYFDWRVWWVCWELAERTFLGLWLGGKEKVHLHVSRAFYCVSVSVHTKCCGSDMWPMTHEAWRMMRGMAWPDVALWMSSEFRISWSRDRGPPSIQGEARPIKPRIGSGRAPEWPDSYFAAWAHARAALTLRVYHTRGLGKG